MSQIPMFKPGELISWADYVNWKPQEPPCLDDVSEVFVDTETTGLRWWAGDRVTGISLATLDGRSWWLPVRQAGGNLDLDTVLRWAQRELRGKRVNAFNARFDIHMLMQDGIDLEAQGCTVSDPGHWAALLNDRRMSTSLESVAQDYLKRGKIRGLDFSHGAGRYHAAEIAEYALNDATLLPDLKRAMWPKLDAEDLQRVRQLEDDCIFVVCEMERNGAPLDAAKLESWNRSSQQEFVAACWRIWKESGISVNPTSRKDVMALMTACGVEARDRTPKGEPSFTKESISAVQHPAIKALRLARGLASVQSKYLVPYLAEVRRDGLLRYSLHQLPVDDEGGTRSGRFSSSKYITEYGEEGGNVQQVAGKKHVTSVKEFLELAKYVIRELFIPASGLWLSADAKQIEYRFFAHYAQPPRVMEAYAQDPDTDFHNFVWSMVQEILPTITRERTKDINFAKIYGARLKKIAVMLGFRSKSAHPDSDEGLAKTRPFVQAYDRVFPEAERLLRKTSDVAERRGYVKTILGRRSRFLPGEPTYSALNRVIQPAAADENKLKLVELHRERGYTGLKLRFTVHDEVCGDIPDLESARRVKEVLNRQLLPSSVPLLWDVRVGPNWKDCKAV